MAVYYNNQKDTEKEKLSVFDVNGEMHEIHFSYWGKRKICTSSEINFKKKAQRLKHCRDLLRTQYYLNSRNNETVYAT